jgi:hypothetical protein
MDAFDQIRFFSEGEGEKTPADCFIMFGSESPSPSFPPVFETDLFDTRQREP